MSLSVAGALLSARPASAQFNYSFDTDAQGWLAGSRPNNGGNPALPPNNSLTNTNATLIYSATGGNAGGYIGVQDTGSGDATLYRAFSNGINLSSFIGGQFRFDARLTEGTIANYAPFGRVRFYSSDGATASNTDDELAAFDIVLGSASPTTVWATYSGTINAANFQVYSPAGRNLSQILSDVRRVEITSESITGFEETVGFDNIQITAAAPEPSSLGLAFFAAVPGWRLLRKRASTRK